MGGRKGGGVNSKVQAANEKKAANKASKDAEAARLREQQSALEWSEGSNQRSMAKKELASQKADEALRRKREKEALLQEEEAALGNDKTKKAVGSGMKAKQQAKKNKGRKKNDLSFLEDQLVSAADKKAIQKKREERLKKEAEEKKQKEKILQKEQELQNMDPLLKNTNDMLGNLDLDSGRNANIQRGIDFDASGVEGALQALGGSGASKDEHPEKRMKALHKAFEEKMMPQMKQDYPGLKMSQYKEKIFNIWKKSPENPMNMNI